MRRAVESAMAQVCPPVEILVVVDGGSPASLRVASVLEGTSARVISTARRVGGGAARNLGVKSAQADWIALLDDDDWWLPIKLKMQLEVLGGLVDFTRPPVVFHSMYVHYVDRPVKVIPQRGPARAESVGDYLFLRRGLRLQHGEVQTSTLLVPRRLLLACPFAEQLPIHQDWDWLLRAVAPPHCAQIHWLPEPLAHWHRDSPGPSVSRHGHLEDSLSWAHSQAHQLSTHAKAGFLLCAALPEALARRNYRQVLSLLRLAVLWGPPRLIDAAGGLYLIARQAARAIAHVAQRAPVRLARQRH